MSKFKEFWMNLFRPMVEARQMSIEKASDDHIIISNNLDGRQYYIEDAGDEFFATWNGKEVLRMTYDELMSRAKDAPVTL